jgi:hypothetical protein
MAEFTGQYKYRRRSTAQSLGPSPSAQSWNTLSNILNDFAATAWDGYGEQRKAEGSAEGSVAGQAGDLKTLKVKEAGTIYSDAFNASQQKAFEARISVDISKKLNEFASKFPNNTKNYKEHVEKYKTGLIDGITDPALKASATQKIADKNLGFEMEIFKAEQLIEHAKAKFDRNEEFDNLKVDMIDGVEQAVRKYHDMDRDPELFADFYAPIFQKQRNLLKKKGIDLLAIPGGSDDVDDVYKRTRGAFNELYGAAALEEFKKATQEGKGYETMNEFFMDSNKFFNSRPHLQTMFPERQIWMDDEAETKVHDNMVKYLGQKHKKVDRDKKIANEELSVDQSESFVDTFTSIVTNDGLTTLDTLVEDQVTHDYNESQYQTLVNAVKLNKYKVDDPDALVDLTTYLLSSDDSTETKQDKILGYYNNNMISGTTAIKEMGDLRSKGFGDVTSSPDFQYAIKAVQAAFQKTTGQTGMFAQGKDLTFMREAEIELYKRVKNGENAFEVYPAIINEYRQLQQDNEKTKFVKTPIFDDKGKLKKMEINCSATLVIIKSKFSRSKNVSNYDEDLTKLERYGCPIE